jgi:hypothetical protein
MSEITMEMARCDDVLERMVPSDVRQLIGRAEKAEVENLKLKAIITKYSHCLPQDAVLDIAKSGILKSGGES